jgi:GntR family transcriptional regulator/MocR family aminotransferase
MLHLDLDRRGALNQQVGRALKAAILEGRLAHGTRLPSSRALALALGVARNTVVDAYEQLLAEGMLESRTGAGTFVAMHVARSASAADADTRIARLSRYGARALACEPQSPLPVRRRALRYNLEYGAPLVLPATHSAWRRALSRAADRSEFDYPPAHGIAALREAIAAYLGRRRGLAVDPEDVLVLAGTQQAVELAARVLVDPGQRAVLEDPCYQGTRAALQALGARLSLIPVDGDGIQTDRLPRGGARLACVTPSHQFPGGSVMSLARRVALLDWARRHDGWIVEDDYDGEFRHDGRPIAALKSLDRSSRVIYIGSFSKLLFPALRLGFAVVPPALRQAFRAAKWLADRGVPCVVQRALADLMASGRFERAARRTGQALAMRRRALLDGLQQHAGDRVQVAGSAAGMHLTCWLPGIASSSLPALVAAAEQHELGLYPITPYFSTPPPMAGLLLGYSGLSIRELDEASRRLGQLLRTQRPSRGR